MKRNQLSVLLIVMSLAFLSACSGGESSNQHADLFTDTAKVKVNIKREVYDEMIQTLPQPIEIAGIISAAKMEFSKDLLIPSDVAAKYPDKHYKAMALGAFGVDLGYINLQEKSLYVLDYLEGIRTIAEQLDVDQFFDFVSLAEMAKNMDNVDSLVETSTRNFRRIDEFLREKNRGEQSVLMLMGAWLEGMHMFVQIEKSTGSEDIRKRIGEQKVVYENISLILSKLTEIEHFKKLKEDLSELDQGYKEVKIRYEYREPEAMEVDGELVFVDKSETMVEMSEETLKKIEDSIEAVRNKYFVLQKA